MDRAHLAKAIGHPLGDPALDAQAFGEVAGVKRLRQRRRQQAAQVGRRAELVDAVHFDEALVFDMMVVVAPPAPPAVARIAPFFDLDERHFERQPAVGKHAREVDQLLEQIEQRSLLRAAAARHDLAARAATLHEVLARR